jgi:acyl dehydratase
MPYDELEESVELTHRGEGALVAFLFTNDPSVAEEGPVLANYGVDNLRFMTPVNAGDALKVQQTEKEFTPKISVAYAKFGGTVL